VERGYSAVISWVTQSVPDPRAHTYCLPLNAEWPVKTGVPTCRLRLARRSGQTDSLHPKSTDTGRVAFTRDNKRALSEGPVPSSNEEEWDRDTPKKRLWSGDCARCGDTCLHNARRGSRKPSPALGECVSASRAG
jgi:hypothetical protein